MKKIYIDITNTLRPSSFEKINSYITHYNFDIREEEDGFIYNSVVVEAPVELISSNVVFKSLIEELYPLSVELKLKNDYEAAVNGILPEDKKQPYLDFLVERKRLHEMVESDCIDNDIAL